MNHGKGKNQAIENTFKSASDLIEKHKATGAHIQQQQLCLFKHTEKRRT